MAKATKLTAAGQSITHRVGRVRVVVTCIRLDSAYRVAVLYGGTETEVPELSGSYSTELVARLVARGRCAMFVAGQTVAQALAA